ncbi:MAG TPA: 4-hydroxy-3-methylbut-2-enyl diphosphate reductase, partial [Akkermansia sp.]|nr:4-hydroxy-3-methylbut-2-enyl diphosphate reductase [Akkermansia sp.]
MNQDSTRKARVNVRRAEVMEQVEKEIQQHYQSELISHIRSAGNVYNLGHTEFFLAREFGFCNGVRRAIDIAYAARRVFPDRRIFLIGDIIHNPEVNRQLEEMGIQKLPWKQLDSSYDRINPDDVVIIPAFGVPTSFMEALEEKGVQIVDTTCGDVMKVWKRVKNYAAMGITSIIHGKATHEETSATASRALGERGRGKYLVVYDLEDARILCDYILGRGDREAFLKRFEGCYSPGFDPDRDLEEVGIANQTTMLKTETQTLQKMVKDAVVQRDGDDDNFYVFDTICGATQDRQDALYELLKNSLDVMFVVGGYNSSNTTHLVDIAREHVPTYF